MSDLGDWYLLPELLGVVGEFLVASEDIVACSRFFVQTSKLLATLLPVTGPWSTYRARSIFYLKKAAHVVADEKLYMKTDFQEWCLRELQAEAPLKRLSMGGMLRIPYYTRDGWTNLLHVLVRQLDLLTSVPIYVLVPGYFSGKYARWLPDKSLFIKVEELELEMKGILFTDDFFDESISLDTKSTITKIDTISSTKLITIFATALGRHQEGELSSHDLFLKVNTLL